MEQAAGGPVYPGGRVLKRNPRYPTMVRGFNARWVGEPEYVQLCGDTAQVVKTVQEAFDQGKRITVRGGGHCYEDFVCDNVGGVLIDLSPMNGVYRETPDEHLFCVEGGATLWNVYNELYRQWGVTLPGGSCYSVGVGGHVTGGGYGLLSRLHGLTVDYLAAVEVVRVNAAGRAEAIVVQRSDAGEAGEIAWAHRGGGGGNFGVVTKFWFADPPAAPQQVQLSSVAWDWEGLNEKSFATLIERFGKFFQAHSDPGDEFAGLFALLHLTQYGGPGSQISLTTQLVGDDPKPLEEFLAALGAGLPAATVQRAPAGHVGRPVASTKPRSLPWLFATQALNGEAPNQYGKYKSAYMIEPFPPAQIKAMWKWLRENPNPAASSALLQVDSYGCQVNAVKPGETAVAQRSSIMKLQYQTYWLDPAAKDQNLGWIRGFYGDMYGPRGPWPDGKVDGCFVNYADVDLVDWQHLYYKDDYARLRKAKSLCDPHNVFHHKQSIEPLGED